MRRHNRVLFVCGAVLAFVAGCGRRPVPERPDLSAPSSDAAATAPYRFEIVPFPGQPARDATAICVLPDGRIVVAFDTGIEILTPAGKRAAAWSTKDTPSCIACSPDGRLFACVENEVVIFDASGARVGGWSDPERIGMPVGIAAADGEVFIADVQTRSVHHYAENGDYIGEIAKRDVASGEPGLVVPSPHLPIALTGDERLILADPGRRMVQVRTFSGELVRKWGRPGLSPGKFSGCCNPVGLAYVSVPKPLIITTEKGARRVQAFFQDGRLAAYAGPENFASQPGVLAAASGPEGRVYVLDAPAQRILILRLQRRKDQALHGQ